MRDADITRKHKNLRLRADAEAAADDRPAEGAEAAGAGRQTGAGRQAAQARRRRGEQELMQAAAAKGAAPASSKKVGADARHRRRDPREVPGAGDPRAQPDEPRDPGVPALPARQADAGARLRPPAGRHLHAQARADGRGDRGGRRLLRPRRQRADEKLQAARDRPAGRLRHALRQVPDRRARPGRAASASPAWSRSWRSCSRRSSSSWASPPCASSTASRSRSRARSRQREGEIQAFTPTIDALYVPDIDDSLDEEGAKQRFWRAFKMLGAWYDDLPPY